MLPRRLLGPPLPMSCPEVVAEVVVSAAPTNVELFEGQFGVGGPFVGPLALLPPPSHSQVRVVVSERLFLASFLWTSRTFGLIFP